MNNGSLAFMSESNLYQYAYRITQAYSNKQLLGDLRVEWNENCWNFVLTTSSMLKSPPIAKNMYF